MRALAVALLAALALGAAGCGFGAGSSSSGGARLEVTRDYGAKHGQRATLAHVHDSDTVMRFLQATHDVETRYGGGFVQSVDGLAGNRARRFDWFFYVNGIESEVGAADFGLSEGDRVQWDLHSWRATMRVPGIVGAFPEPFSHGYRGKRLPVRVECAEPDGPACKEATKRLADSGAVASSAPLGVAGEESIARVVVSTWDAMRRLQAASPLARGPQESGVFARFAGNSLQLLDSNGRVARTAPPGTGLVAARVPRERDVVWFVTGVDEAGVRRAAAALDEDTLENAFALAATPSGPVKLPVADEK
ncbi:MAG TPA: DUF4430 domain-containing protein [Thermoleophilaceae bacterium]|nr:DUF4430 domain-containing protein [Thermoleophilaceae bacterium]